MAAATLLRQDLNLYPAEPLSDGSPAWVLHDPAADHYFHLNWLQVQMLGFVDSGDAQAIANRCSEHAGTIVSLEEAEEFLTFLGRYQLLACRGEKNIKALSRQAQERRSGRWKRLLRQYLYIRIPLWRPDSFLRLAAPWINWLFHPLVCLLLGAAGLTGLYLAARQVEVFFATAANFFTTEGVLIYAAVIALVKVVHELGHAFVAYRHGCRVRRIGVIILVFFPVLYTDVSDSWRLQNRRDRLLIGSAGMLAELAIACVALFCWGILPDGIMRELAFALATASWLSTLLVNLNPLLRFDGYYLLSDYWGVPNLQARAMALIRWHVGRILIGLTDDPPETPQRHLLIYGWLVGAYRLFLFVVISALLYHLFFKTLAVILICMMFSKSVAEPLVKGCLFVWRRRYELRVNTVLVRTSVLLLILVAMLLVPWRGTVRAPAVLQPVAQHVSYSPFDGQIVRIAVETGDKVAEGQTLAVVHSPDLKFEQQSLEQKITDLNWQLEIRGFDPVLLDRLLILETDYRTSLQRHAALNDRLEQGTIRSPIKGKFTSLDQGLEAGSWVAGGEALFSVSTDQHWQVVAYVNEADLGRISLQNAARFYPNRGGQPPVPLQVSSIERVALKEFDSLYPAEPFGGPIAAHRGEGDSLVPLTAIYRVALTPAGEFSQPERVLAGSVAIAGEKESLLNRIVQNFMGVLRRESGF